MNDNDNIQSPGRDANGAQPLNASDNTQGAERYPRGETRAFERTGNPEPPQGAGDGGAGADPEEGKR